MYCASDSPLLSEYVFPLYACFRFTPIFTNRCFIGCRLPTRPLYTLNVHAYTPHSIISLHRTNTHTVKLSFETTTILLCKVHYVLTGIYSRALNVVHSHAINTFVQLLCACGSVNQCQWARIATNW